MVTRYERLSKGQKSTVRAKLNRQQKEQAEFDAETERLVRQVQRMKKQRR